MQQTMLSIIAMMILSLFVVNKRRSVIQTQSTMIHNAVAVLGNGVAVERLSRIRTMSFDQATTGDTFIDAPSGLTLRSGFGPGQDTENDDLDDFDGAVKDIYRVIGTDSLGFRVESTVTYADENDPSQDASSTIRTKYKKVSVKVYSLDLADADTVRITQSFSCKNACNW